MKQFHRQTSVPAPDPVAPGWLGAAAWGLRKRVDVYDALVCGGREGLTVAAGLVPPLATLLTAVYMFRASGALELLTNRLAQGRVEPTQLSRLF